MLTNYFKATPKKWRIIGDSLLAVSVFITENSLSALQSGQADASEVLWIARIAIGIGVLGKFLTNFFKEENNIPDPSVLPDPNVSNSQNI